MFTKCNDVETIIQDVQVLLCAFGFQPQITTNDHDTIKIRFICTKGYDALAPRYIDAIIMLTKGFLNEFYFCKEHWNIILNKTNTGLDPDDDRYRTLLKTIKDVPSASAELQPYHEIFLNQGEEYIRLTPDNN